MVAADGAEGYPPSAPYDRVIATVGVSDLAPAWLDQTGPGGRIVVPLDVRGTQLAVAFERLGTGGRWTSVSLAPCGFMRMRGSLAGPGTHRARSSPVFLSCFPTGSRWPTARKPTPRRSPPTWLAVRCAPDRVSAPRPCRSCGDLACGSRARDARSCAVAEERPAGSRGRRRAPASWPGAARLLQAPIRTRGLRLTGGILDSGGIALVTATPLPGAGGDADEPPGRLTLEVAGFGPHGPGLAAELAAHIQAWDAQASPASTDCTSRLIRGHQRTSPVRPRTLCSLSGPARGSPSTTTSLDKRDKQPWRPSGNRAEIRRRRRTSPCPTSAA